MKILVVGASSFYGSVFCNVARQAGHDLVELSRPEYDLNLNLPEKAYREVQAGARRVVNFAALNMVGESWSFAPAYYLTNVVGIARLAEALERGGAELFVQVSTPEVYGAARQRLGPDEPFEPSTPYANSRAAADRHLALMFSRTGFPVCFTRTVNIYGPHQQAYRIVPKTAIRALSGTKLLLHGGGVSERSFIHSWDAARAVLRVLEDGVAGRTYHISGAPPISIRELVQRVCQALGRNFYEVVEDAPDRPGKDPVYLLDDTKTREELGWSPEISLEDGLAATLEWVRHNLSRLREEDEYRFNG